MRTFLCIALAAILASVAAIPITPSAPRLQRRAEQYRIQGMREFDIAERLSGSLSESTTFGTRINNRFHSIFNSHSSDDIDDEHDLFDGDIAPGSLDAPSVLPKAKDDERESYFRSLCALFHGSDHDRSGYEGKEGELKRPSGMRQWSHALGGFRR